MSLDFRTKTQMMYIPLVEPIAWHESAFRLQASPIGEKTPRTASSPSPPAMLSLHLLQDLRIALRRPDWLQIALLHHPGALLLHEIAIVVPIGPKHLVFIFSVHGPMARKHCHKRRCGLAVLSKVNLRGPEEMVGGDVRGAEFRFDGGLQLGGGFEMPCAGEVPDESLQ